MKSYATIENNQFVIHIRNNEKISAVLSFRPYIEPKLHQCKYCGALTVTDDENCLEKPPMF